METIHFKYSICQGDEQVFESTAEVKITQKLLKDTEAFVREHDFSPEFQDIPSAIYDKCGDAAYGAALKAYPKFSDIEEGLELDLEQYMPVSLIMLFSDEVKRKMLTEDPYYMEESEIFGEPEAESPVEAALLDAEEDGCDESPCKENTLYLPIKQVYFDQIVAGTKKKEYREIKDTTFRKYLECDEDGFPYINPELVDVNDSLCGDIYIWNKGVYPYIPKLDYLYLHLAVGYNKERDEAVVEIEDMTFEPLLDKKGNPCRFSVKDGDVKVCADGELCFWQVVFHLGEVVECRRK